MESIDIKAMPVYERIDWPVVLTRLVKSGISLEDTAKITGFGVNKVFKIIRESVDLSSMNSTCTLMQLYKDSVGGEFPVVGEHNELDDL